MKSLNLFLCLSVLTLIVGCKSVTIENGEVPDQYLPQAKAYEGVYSGAFNGIAGDLIISFQGNKPIVTYKNTLGSVFLPFK